ncbi:MAG: hypothetical protein EBZ78_12480, partial [Verrucomicrobia bacterium]|nr:hypothetical protein [Verrucomicrobiota bacterium]
MKQIVSNYTYNPASNVVTLGGLNIGADQLLLIVAPGVGRTMYNFASVTGSVVAGSDTRVTLNASTLGLTTTSPLVIFYDDQSSAQAVTGTVGLDPASLLALENVTVTIGSNIYGTVTISNLPATQAISGTVTANTSFGSSLGLAIEQVDDSGNVGQKIAVQLYNPTGLPVGASGETLAVSGTVTIGSLPAISGTVTANLGGIAGG